MKFFPVKSSELNLRDHGGARSWKDCSDESEGQIKNGCQRVSANVYSRVFLGSRELEDFRCATFAESNDSLLMKQLYHTILVRIREDLICDFSVNFIHACRVSANFYRHTREKRQSTSLSISFYFPAVRNS